MVTRAARFQRKLSRTLSCRSCLLLRDEWFIHGVWCHVWLSINVSQQNVTCHALRDTCWRQGRGSWLLSSSISQSQNLIFSPNMSCPSCYLFCHLKCPAVQAPPLHVICVKSGKVCMRCMAELVAVGIFSHWRFQGQTFTVWCLLSLSELIMNNWSSSIHLITNIVWESQPLIQVLTAGLQYPLIAASWDPVFILHHLSVTKPETDMIKLILKSLP